MGTYQRLVWKTTSGKNTTKILPLSMINEIRETQINGVPCMIIQTKERKFVFKSAQNGLVSAWVQNLMNTLNKIIMEKQNNITDKPQMIDKAKKMMEKQKAIMDEANVEKEQESNGKEMVILSSKVPEDTEL